MSEDRLRDLLQRAVPEAPEVRPDGVAERAAVLRRRRTFAGATALAVAATMAVAALALLGGSDHSTVSPADQVPTTPSGSTAPYEVPVCPTRLPEAADADYRIPDLDDVVAVRDCPDLQPGFTFGPRGGYPPRAAVRRLADMDALLDADRLGEAIASLTPTDPTLCATLDVITTRESLMFVLADGTTVLVRTQVCTDVEVDGERVDGELLLTAFQIALDEQRDQLAYTRPFRGSPCAAGSFTGPARPGRELLVSACFVGNDGPVELDDDQLAALRAAWADPQPLTEDVDETGENNCTEGGDGTQIYAGTDRSDLVRLFQSPCGYLVWNGWERGQIAAIPTTVEELGLR